MFRSFLTAALVAVFASATVSAEPADVFRDSLGRFTVRVPAGWTTQKPDSKLSALALFMVSAKKGGDNGGVCLVLVNDMPQTRELTQSELDEAFSKVLTKDFWQKSFEAGGVKDILIDDSGVVTHKGRRAYFLVATATSTGSDGKVFSATSKQMIHPVPGDLFFVQCTASKTGFAAMKPEFDQVFASFDPRVNETLVMGPHSAPSVLTLFNGPGLDGIAHAVAQNTANIPALTGSAISAGVSIAGYGQWEVCEGVNYGGACRVVAAAETAEPGAFLKIGSVRRYDGGAEKPRQAVGVISAGAAYALRNGLDKFGGK